jgi:hypothetical protein
MIKVLSSNKTNSECVDYCFDEIYLEKVEERERYVLNINIIVLSPSIDEKIKLAYLKPYIEKLQKVSKGCLPNTY